MTTWRPRSSSMGHYIACDFRAAMDRAIDEGLLELTVEEKTEMKAGNQYTDFGTVAHFVLQDGTGCLFPGPSKDYAPTPDEVKQAAGMTSGDADLMWKKAREVATLGAKFLPKAPDGKPWLSEIPFGKEADTTLPFSGTLDFLAQDFSELGDLKTTSRPPEKNRIRTPHLIQITAYAWLVKQVKGVLPKRGWILYVSSKAEWVIPPIYVNYEAMGDFIDMIPKQVDYWRGPQVYDLAMPRLLNEECREEHYCPHVGRCREKIRPGAGQRVDAIPAVGTVPIRTKNIFAKPQAQEAKS